MSDLAIWITENPFISQILILLLSIISLFCVMFSFVIMANKTADVLNLNLNKKHNLCVSAILLSTFFWIFGLSNVFYGDYVRGKKEIAGVNILIKENNQYNIIYRTTGKVAKGYDLKGNTLYETKEYPVERTIFCQIDEKQLDYRSCWNMLKNKSRDELITMSSPRSENKYITMVNK